MAWTWKFDKPVSHTTLTSNGYSVPDGAPNPTNDALKAQLDEMRQCLDSADNKINCSSRNFYTQRRVGCLERYSNKFGTVKEPYCPAVYGPDYQSRYEYQGCSTTNYPRYSTVLRSNGCSTRQASDCDSVMSRQFGTYNSDKYGSVKTYYGSAGQSTCETNRASYYYSQYYNEKSSYNIEVYSDD